MACPLSESLVRPDSLGDTIDAVNVALFNQTVLSLTVCTEAAVWIADRQGLPGSYAGMFAPTAYDYAFGTLTFTGEPVRSGAATGHILSEESCRVLYRLEGKLPVSNNLSVHQALDKARQAIFKRMEQSEVKGQWSGVYCCGTCSVALWRHLQASGAPDDLRRLEHGLTELRRHRDGEGRWKRFPFYYTLLALIEMELPGVQDEILYAGSVIERALRRLRKIDPQAQSEHDRRRKIVMEQVLEKC
jgi:hypothetical protein